MRRDTRDAAATTPSTGMDTVPTGGAFWARVQVPQSSGLSQGCVESREVIILNRRHDRPLCRRTVAALAHTLRDPMLERSGSGTSGGKVSMCVRPEKRQSSISRSLASQVSSPTTSLFTNSTLLLQAARGREDGRPCFTSPPRSRRPSEDARRPPRYRRDGLLLWPRGSHRRAGRARRRQAAGADRGFHPDRVPARPGVGARLVASARVCGALMTQAKGRGLATFLVGHVTKDGAIAGPAQCSSTSSTPSLFEGEQQPRVSRAARVKTASSPTNRRLRDGRARARRVRTPRASSLDAPWYAPARWWWPASRHAPMSWSCRPSSRAPRRHAAPHRARRRLQPAFCLLLAVLEKRAAAADRQQDVFGQRRGRRPRRRPAAGTSRSSSRRRLPTWSARCPADVVVLARSGSPASARGGGPRGAAALRRPTRVSAAIVPRSGAADVRSAPLKRPWRSHGDRGPRAAAALTLAIAGCSSWCARLAGAACGGACGCARGAALAGAPWRRRRGPSWRSPRRERVPPPGPPARRREAARHVAIIDGRIADVVTTGYSRGRAGAALRAGQRSACRRRRSAAAQPGKRGLEILSVCKISGAWSVDADLRGDVDAKLVGTGATARLARRHHRPI